MRAYSVDLRRRVVAAVEGGMPRSQVAETFRVSLATIKRWLVLRRHDTGLTPKVSLGRPRQITHEQHANLWAQLEANHDATIREQTRLWNLAQGTSVSEWTVGRAIRRLGWTFKKVVGSHRTGRACPDRVSGAGSGPRWG